MINKTVAGLDEAVAGMQDGAVLMISGFGGAGMPFDLVDAVVDTGVRNLTVISNNAGSGGTGIGKLIREGRVGKVVCSFPRQPGSEDFDEMYRAGKIELELVPQGTLAERIRAGGAGVGAFFTQTGVGTELAKGKEVRVIDGVEQILEYALTADFALVRAKSADRWGNLTYRGTARNFGPIMATAAKCTVAEVLEIVPLGSIDPEHIVTPGVFVDRVVAVEG